jgi:(1->4)-alpha-D-glucan 1-alpha-D-glucosylmutase
MFLYMRIPVSTYRVQFNRDFRFADALRIIPYLDELGITDLYASPILKARPGSLHGYDVTDPTQLNPELGTPEEFDELCRELQARHMGLLLDIVPNHMAASLENPWWFDVLEKGEGSPYAPFFDVNWDSTKVLLPILGKPYGEALESRELKLKMENGRAIVQYYEHKLPIAAGAEYLSADAVDRVLSQQHYRLAYWRKAADSINYRRFFDISDLVGLRIERDDVFHATHKYVVNLIHTGKVTGLRLDHIDGLLDPFQYLKRLPKSYVITEKILDADERLPSNWRIQGTSGYDFLNFLNGAFIDREGFSKLEKAYQDFTGLHETRASALRRCKQQIMEDLFAGELSTLVHRLTELAQDDRHARDIRVEELRKAFISVTASLPVYRTYIRDEHVPERDRLYIDHAIIAAGSGPPFDFLRRVFLIQPAWYLQNRKQDYVDFVMHWQQFTGPLMAKGLEDTAFYVHNPLVSINEVGGGSNGPDTYFGVEQFHRRNLARHTRWPHTMNATSTHDTKRSEDARTRINVLSEVPDEWARCLRRWRRMNPITAPDANEQALIYQSMLGAWPIEPERLKQYVTKALREAKTHTSWTDLNEGYEKSVLCFVDSLYGNEAFLKDFTRLQKKLAYFGALSSLAQLVLKMTSPGVPDFYRGTEIWDLSLADPDNRRAVDFSSRTQMLEELKQAPDLRQLLKHWPDGRLKMFVTRTLLHFRRGQQKLFSEGQYIPIRVTGVQADHVIAFARRLHDAWCIVAVPRLCASLTRVGSAPIGEKVWGDTRIELPKGAPSSGQDIFTNMEVSAGRVSELFRVLPLCVLKL